MENKELPERLIALRKARRKNRRQVAEEMGMSYGTLTNYEQGERVPRPEAIMKLADYYGVTVDELLGISHQQEPEPKRDIDYDRAFVALKQLGFIAQGRTISESDTKFIKSLVVMLRAWFE